MSRPGVFFCYIRDSVKDKECWEIGTLLSSFIPMVQSRGYDKPNYRRNSIKFNTRSVTIAVDHVFHSYFYIFIYLFF